MTGRRQKADSHPISSGDPAATAAPSDRVQQSRAQAGRGFIPSRPPGNTQVTGVSALGN